MPTVQFDGSNPSIEVSSSQVILVCVKWINKAKQNKIARSLLQEKVLVRGILSRVFFMCHVAF